VRTRGQNWLLHTDAKQMTALTVGQYGLPIEPFFDLVGARPGEAVLIVADSGAALSLGVGVAAKSAVRGVPQGVTFVSGQPTSVASFVANELLRPGQSVADAKQYAPQGVSVAGFVPRAQGIVSYQDNRPTPGQIEQSLGDQARQANTVDFTQCDFSLATQCRQYTNWVFNRQPNQPHSSVRRNSRRRTAHRGRATPPRARAKRSQLLVADRGRRDREWTAGVFATLPRWGVLSAGAKTA